MVAWFGLVLKGMDHVMLNINHCCKGWSAQLGNQLDQKCVQAGKLLGNVHVSKPVPNLCMSCVHASLHGHTLYTGATA